MWRSAVASLASLALAAPAAAQAPPVGFEDPPIAIDRLLSLNVALEPADRELFESLFIAPLRPATPTSARAQPERPLIDFKVHEVGEGTYEMWVDLRGEYCATNGWFNRATGVYDPALFTVSRASGYPKFRVDDIKIEDRKKAGWSAEVSKDGAPLVTLEWREDPVRVAELYAAAPWQRYWTAGEGRLYQGVSWAFEPYPNQGPFVKWIETKPVEGEKQTWDSRRGVVRVTVRQGITGEAAQGPEGTEGNWMPLVPRPVEAPGMIERYEGSAEFAGRRDECAQPDARATKPAVAECVERPAVRARRVGPARLAVAAARLVRRLGTPLWKSERGLGWCLRGGGELLVALDGRKRVRAAVSSGVRPRGPRLPRGSRLVAAGVYRSPGKPARLYGLRGGRLRLAGIAPRSAVSNPMRARALLRGLGL